MLLKVKKFLTPALHVPEDFRINQIFKPFYFLLTFVGLFPYSVTYNATKERYRIIQNSVYINVFCAFCYAIPMVAVCVIHIKDVLNTSNDAVNTLADVLITQLNYLLEITALVAFALITYINAFVNRYKYVKILNDISLIWTESRNDNRTEILRHLRFQINVIAFGSTLVIFVVQLCVNTTRDEGLWKAFLVSFTGVIPSLLQTIVLAFHYILVMMATTILTDINQQLVKVTKQQKPIQDLPLNVNTRRHSSFLRQLEDQYKKAFEIKTTINNAFQAPILITAIQSFHCIVSEAYIIYHRVMQHVCTPHNIVNGSMWIVLQLLKIYSLAYSGNVIREENTKIGQNLHNISTEKQDLKTFLEVQHFCSLMKYHDFALTVYGYFPLNAGLTSAIIANATMYIIILIQFDKSNATSTQTPAAGTFPVV